MTLTFPPHLQFIAPWRQYQQKILDETDLLLSQRKFHLVAPPGSGKTILGLELMLRINQKTLILAPTLVIREQWIERLIADFGAEVDCNWISREIQSPALLTVCTYQAFHQAWKINPAIIDYLKSQDIQTLIVDECHHLQKEWWKPLIALKNHISPCLIALTATPPYDVGNHEWAKYYELCGEIDEIIYTPELVAVGDLCPHQDYIYFTLPTTQELSELGFFHQAIQEFEDDLQHNYRFIALLKAHPWLNQPALHTEAIYENPTYFSALMIGLEGLGKVAPVSALGIIGADESQIPPLSPSWLEILLQNVLFKDPYFSSFLTEPSLQRISKNLRRIGALEKRRVYLQEPPRLAQNLRSSSSKLNAVVEIARVEVQNQGKDLRMVILCDYIHKDFLPENELDDPQQERIGVVPVFESLRRAFPLGLEIGILSGSLVVIPKASETLLDELLLRWQLSVTDLKRTPLSHDGLYIKIEATGKSKTKLIGIITALFAAGGIQTLVGTTALLGEGWDAPEINTLVLATFVGSHVLSNQMRGRAIRVHRQLKEKTANIWHLVCIDNFSQEGGSDLFTLKRRMAHFYGISSASQPSISNGLDRLQLPSPPFSKEGISTLNYNMAVYARARPRLQEAWQEAIKRGYSIQEKVRIPHSRNQTYQGKRKIAIQQTAEVYKNDFRRFNLFTLLLIPVVLGLVAFAQFIGWSFGGLLAAASAALILLCFLDFSQLRNLVYVPQIIRYFSRMLHYRPFLGLRMGLVGIVAIWMMLQWGLDTGFAFIAFIVVGWMAFLSIFNATTILGIWTNLRRINDPQVFFHSTAEALFETMLKSQQLSSNEREAPMLEINGAAADGLLVAPSNVDTRSAQLYLNALQELLNPIENPRYLLALKYTFDKSTSMVYYFPVPTCMGKKKKDAELFQDIWMDKLGPTRLIYTRTIDGRLELLKARGQSLGLQPDSYAMQVNSWE
jgi:superfamily II DNA or RNA helicase